MNLLKLTYIAATLLFTFFQTADCISSFKEPVNLTGFEKDKNEVYINIKRPFMYFNPNNNINKFILENSYEEFSIHISKNTPLSIQFPEISLSFVINLTLAKTKKVDEMKSCNHWQLRLLRQNYEEDIFITVGDHHINDIQNPNLKFKRHGTEPIHIYFNKHQNLAQKIEKYITFTKKTKDGFFIQKKIKFNIL